MPFFTGTLGEKFLRLLGLIMSDFSLLERLLLSNITHLIYDDSKPTKLLIGTDNFTTLLSKYKNLLVYRLQENNLYDETIAKEFNDLYSRLEKANKKRNDLIHSVWSTDIKGTTKRSKFLKTIDKNFKIEEFTTMDFDSVKCFSDEIQTLSSNLFAFREKIIKLLSLKVSLTQL